MSTDIEIPVLNVASIKGQLEAIKALVDSVLTLVSEYQGTIEGLQAVEEDSNAIRNKIICMGQPEEDGDSVHVP